MTGNSMIQTLLLLFDAVVVVVVVVVIAAVVVVAAAVAAAAVLARERFLLVAQSQQASPGTGLLLCCIEPQGFPPCRILLRRGIHSSAAWHRLVLLVCHSRSQVVQSLPGWPWRTHGHAQPNEIFRMGLNLVFWVLNSYS